MVSKNFYDLRGAAVNTPACDVEAPGSIPGQVMMENDLFLIGLGLGCVSIYVSIINLVSLS